jgi:hypothetical protein
MRWRRPPKASSMPRWTAPSRRIRSPTPSSFMRSTVPCSSTPARIVASMSFRLRLSRTTDSIPCRCRRCESSSPAGPAPMMPTWVRMTPPLQPFAASISAKTSCALWYAAFAAGTPQ